MNNVTKILIYTVLGISGFTLLIIAIVFLIVNLC